MCIRNTKQRRARGAALAAFLIALACPNADAANLLQNPAFEKVGADSVPEAWVREYDPALGGPFQVVQDARAGANAVCLMTEEWNIDRPQFVTQRVALPPGSRALQLTARCRGQGTVRLALGFLRGGRPLATVTNQPYFGTYVLPVEAENVAGLGPEYRARRGAGGGGRSQRCHRQHKADVELQPVGYAAGGRGRARAPSVKFQPFCDALPMLILLSSNKIHFKRCALSRSAYWGHRTRVQGTLTPSRRNASL